MGSLCRSRMINILIEKFFKNYKHSSALHNKRRIVYKSLQFNEILDLRREKIEIKVISIKVVNENFSQE